MAIPINKEFELACKDGDLETVRRLLQEGVDPDSFYYEGVPPLYDAVKTNKSKLVELLLQYGANVATEMYTESLILNACFHESEEILESLLKPRYVPKKVMLLCCIREYIQDNFLSDNLLPLDMFKEIVKETRISADPNEVDEDSGSTTTFAAITTRSLAIVKILVDHGADPNKCIHNGKFVKLRFVTGNVFAQISPGFPLLWAIQVQSFEIVEFLLKNGADPNQVIEIGEEKTSPLLEALSNKNSEIIELLIRNGAIQEDFEFRE
jgi:ankyrin repeat protein